jgi:hypothetical protein
VTRCLCCPHSYLHDLPHPLHTETLIRKAKFFEMMHSVPGMETVDADTMSRLFDVIGAGNGVEDLDSEGFACIQLEEFLDFAV